MTEEELEREEQDVTSVIVFGMKESSSRDSEVRVADHRPRECRKY